MDPNSKVPSQTAGVEVAPAPAGGKESRSGIARRSAAIAAGAQVQGAVGPAIRLEVLEGPMDGALLAGRYFSVRIGRAAGNDLELAADRLVSGKHAVLTCSPTSREWTLEDCRSLNGTWFDGARLTSPSPFALGNELMVGHAVIRVTAGDGGESFVPSLETLHAEGRRLLGRLASEAAKGFGAALMLASQEKRSYLTDRQLFMGLAMASPRLAGARRPGGALVAQFLSGAIRRNEYWVGPKAWINLNLKAVGVDEEVFFEDEFTITPRLLRLLLQAEQAAGSEPGASIQAEDILAVLLGSPGSRSRELLERGGVDLAELLAAVSASAPARESVAVRREGPERSTFLPPPVTSGDAAIDRQAQETSKVLAGLAALYHLADPEERRRAIRQALSGEVGKLPADRRALLLEQLRRIFPVYSGPPVDDVELSRLRRRVRELEKAGEEQAAKRPAAAAGLAPWRALVQGAGSAELAALPPADRLGCEFLRDVVTFANELERFIVADVHNLTTHGSQTEIVYLPGYRNSSLRKLSDQLAAGKALAPEAWREYLEAIKLWLLAVSAAYHESPAAWFEGFRAKVGPEGIKTRLVEGTRKKAFRIEEVELWKLYVDTIRVFDGKDVAYEMLSIAGNLAQEHFERLHKGRSSE